MSSSGISIRPMTTEDCASVVGLIRNCYGDSYGVDYFYHVDDLIAKLASGQLRSVVALKNGQVVGHMALLLLHPQARVCEAGNTVICHTARNEGLMMQLAQQLHELAIEAGFVGYIHYPTTAHPIMQKTSVDYGGVETGIMLRYSAAQSDYPQSATSDGRLATTVAYQPVSDAPVRELSRLPERYATFIGDRYQQLDLPRQFGSQPSLPLAGDTNLTASFNQRWQYLQITVERAGENLANEVAALIIQYRPCVSYIDLAVDANAIDRTLESLNELGFFYAALLPDFAGVDILRLQKLTDASEADFHPNLANDSAHHLLAFIRNDASSIGVLQPSHL